MNKWQNREKELPEKIRVWLNTLLDLPEKEIKSEIATYLVEHNANLMQSLERATRQV